VTILGARVDLMHAVLVVARGGVKIERKGPAIVGDALKPLT
jgi:hypothetical protein